MWDRIKSDIRNYWKVGALLGLYFLITQVMFHQFCPMVLMTGLPCPGCGMTRALVLVLQLRLGEAFQMHPLIYGWISLGILFFIRRYGMGKTVRPLQKYAGILLLAMIVVYVYRMIQFFPNEEPMVYVKENILYQIYQKRRNASLLPIGNMAQQAVTR